MSRYSDDKLTDEESQALLRIARLALESTIRGTPFEPLEEETISPKLKENGATFVTLTIDGRLRGCIGALEPRHPLVDDVRDHAIAAATQDYRFPRVRPAELERIKIEISRLSTPVQIDYEDSQDLIRKLRPGIDGVVIKDGFRRATFLPQVWEKLPDKVQFMNQLCLKMGADPEFWRTHKLEVLVYQVEEFHE